MRAYAWIFALILALSLAAGIVTAVNVGGTADKVEVAEFPIFGDPDSAAGLRVTASTTLDFSLFWKTEFTPGETESARTDFTYDHTDRYQGSMDAWQPSAALDPYTVDLTWKLYPNSGATVQGWGWMLEFYRDIVADVASRTQPGTVRTETVSLADWTDRLYLTMTCSLWASVWRSDAQDVRQISEIFKLPTRPEYYMAVSVARDGEGEYRSVHTSAGSGPAEPIINQYRENVLMFPDSDSRWLRELVGANWGGCAATDGTGVWLYPSIRDENGAELMEYRDGPGVYYMPVLTAENWDDHANPASEPGDVLVRETRLIYATEAEPVRLDLAPDGALRLFTREFGALVLTVLDPATGEERQRLRLRDMAADDRLSVFDKGDLTLLTLSGGGITLLVTEDGEVTVPLDLTLDLSKEYTYDRSAAETRTFALADQWRLNECDIAWDGNYLAMSYRPTQTVLILSPSGPISLTAYDFSPLWEGNTGDGPTAVAGELYAPSGVPLEVEFSSDTFS